MLVLLERGGAPSAVANSPLASISGRGSSAARASSRSSVNASLVCAASASCILSDRLADGPTAGLTTPDSGTSQPEVVDKHASSISALHISMSPARGRRWAVSRKLGGTKKVGQPSPCAQPSVGDQGGEGGRRDCAGVAARCSHNSPTQRGERSLALLGVRAGSTPEVERRTRLLREHVLEKSLLG